MVHCTVDSARQRRQRRRAERLRRHPIDEQLDVHAVVGQADEIGLPQRRMKLPREQLGIRAADAKSDECADVPEDGRLHGRGECGGVPQAADEPSSELAQLGKHRG